MCFAYFVVRHTHGPVIENVCGRGECNVVSLEELDLVQESNFMNGLSQVPPSFRVAIITVQNDVFGGNSQLNHARAHTHAHAHRERERERELAVL